MLALPFMSVVTVARGIAGRLRENSAIGNTLSNLGLGGATEALFLLEVSFSVAFTFTA